MADLQITKTDNTTTINPGAVDTYTIRVTNAGPQAVTGASFSDPVPASLLGVSYTTSVSGGATATPASGTGNNISGSLNVPVGGTVIYTVTGTLDPNATFGTLTNIATVLPPAGINDPNTGNNTAIDQDTIVPVSDLAVNKSFTFTDLDGSGTLTPGDRIVFAVNVTNNGPNAAQGVSVVDMLPTGYQYVSDDAKLNGGTYQVGTGLWTIGNLGAAAPNNTAVLHITAIVGPSGNYTNAAAINTSNSLDPIPGNNSSSVTPPVQPVSDLGVSKTLALTTDVNGDGVISIGDRVTFTLTLNNAGPDPAMGVHVTDLLPAGYTFFSANPSQGMYTSATGDWNVGTVNVLSTQTLSIVATVVGNKPDSAYTNPAQVSASGSFDPNTSNNSASATPFIADLSVTKTGGLAPGGDLDNSGSLTVGDLVLFTVTVSNAGPDFATGVQLVDQLAAGYTYASDDSGGTYNSSTGLWNVGVVAPGTTQTLHITASVNPSGPYSNTAQVTASDQFDPNSTPNNNVPTEDDQASITLAPGAAQTDLQITKTDNKTSAIPGTADTYSIVVTNAGTVTATGALVRDLFPPTFTNVTFTATATGGATGFTASGSGNINDTVTMPMGSTITYLATGTILASATGSLTNTATVTPPANLNDPDPTNNTATDTDTLTPQADLSILKTDGSATAVPGTNVVYTITVTNNGPSTVTGATVSDVLPAGTTFVAASGGATYNSGTNTVTYTTGTVAPGGTSSFTLTLAIASTLTGNLANTATVTPPAGVTDPNPNNNTSTDTDMLTPQADLQITKTDSKTSAVPGTSNTYAIVVTNAGPSRVTGATVTDTFPATFTGVTWTATTLGGATGFTASGSGNINDTVTMPVGSTITYLVTGTISPGATVSLSNTATVTAPAGVTDPTPGNNSANDTDTLTPQADLQITKTDNKTTAVPGTTDTYTIVVTNAGPSNVTGATVMDTFPAIFTGVTWTATATGGATGFTVSGSGNINDTVTMPVGSTITYLVTGTISAAATGSLSNTATVTAPAGVTDTNTTNNSATDTDMLTPQADLGVTKTVSNATPNVGNTITFTVTLTNHGPSTATGVTVQDSLPSGLTFVSALPSTGTYDAPSGVWTVGTVTTATPQTLQIQATVVSSGATTNTASISHSDAADTDTSNNSASATETPQQADLALTKNVSNATPIVGSNITFTVTLSNGGPNPATNVTVTDLLPMGLTLVSGTPNQGTYNTTTGVWTVGTVTPGTPLTLTLQATVNSPNSLTNTAMVTAADQFDPDTTNNSASATETPQKASPTLGTTPNPTTITLGATTPPILKDAATLSGGFQPTGTITFTLFYNSGSTPVDTEMVTVTGDGTYMTPTGFTLPASGTVSGTYQWNAS
jgi:uncharacterized repeat protein (TIGR01451 family)